MGRNLLYRLGTFDFKSFGFMSLEFPTPKPAGFPSTHWSSVLAAAESTSEKGLQALGNLLTRYQPALTFYLQKKFFYKEEEAKDIFHDFVLQNILKRELISQLRPMKGYEFRRFLLCSLHTFAISQYRRRTAQKRRPTEGLTSLDELTDVDLNSGETPKSGDFDVAWARTVLQEALRRMYQECRTTNRMDIWGVFENRLRKPLLEGKPLQPYDELVKEFGFKSPAQAHNVLVTAKRSFARCLEQVVGEYALDKNAVEAEIRELQVILSHSG